MAGRDYRWPGGTGREATNACAIPSLDWTSESDLSRYKTVFTCNNRLKPK